MRRNARVGKTKTTCGACHQESKYLGALSGTCPECQNKSVAELEASLGLPKGSLGRVDAKGNE